MEVDIIGSAGEVSAERVRGRSVSVIDVFRATSVIVTAIGNGAREIIPRTGIEESFRLRDELVAAHAEGGDPGPVLLGGERNTEIVEGFDLDNSPLRYTPGAVRDATIVLSTTNGTRAVNSVRQGEAAEIYIAALLNADAVARRLGESGRDVALVCSGRDDRFTIEDALCGGMMARYLERYGYKLTDMAWWCADMYRRYEDDLQSALDHCEHYHRIRERWADDIAWCLQRNVTEVAPRITKEGGIRP